MLIFLFLTALSMLLKDSYILMKSFLILAGELGLTFYLLDLLLNIAYSFLSLLSMSF